MADLFPENPAPLAQGKGKIRPRARLLRTIGAELISSEVVAVIELVRNCYDADASLVELRFDSPEVPTTASLNIHDNGHGMTREVLLGPWMEPATDHKSHTAKGSTAGERSPTGRRRLGSKGVGRFAVQRLGLHLELRTRPTDSDNELIAQFDWLALEQDKYLDQVSIPWHEQKAVHMASHGTDLNITRLRDAWTPERFEKLRIGLSRLVSPCLREAFAIKLIINGAEEEIRPAIEGETSMYSIRGTVHEGGACDIFYTDINGAEEQWERTVYWPAGSDSTCGSFEFQINAWDLDREPLNLFLKKTGSKLGLRDFRKAIRNHSGISLYRDGFRILPYGEPDNDWLRLDRRRVNNPTMRLSNNQILGSIQLTADVNSDLRDQTNREGLVTNEAYQHLLEVVLELLAYFETRRFSARRSMDIDWQRRSSSLPALGGEDADLEIEKLLKTLGQGTQNTTKELDNLRATLKGWRETSADVVRHYAGLASVGQMSSIIFRQMKHPIRQIRTDLTLALEDAQGAELDAEDLQDMAVSLANALKLLESMETRMEKMDPLAVGGRGRRVSRQLINDIILDVVGAYQEEFDRYGVILQVIGNPKAQAQTNREAVQLALANLLENALYWSQQTDTDTFIVTVSVGEDGFYVCDNGPGIADSLADTVFEPHFTSRDDASGMGLTLTRDLLQSVGARIQLTDPKNARFAVELSATKKK